MNWKIILLVTFLCGLWFSASAQTPTEEAARSELVKRGYDADRFQQEMINKGVDPAKVDINNPADLARARKAAEEVAAMLDAEKNASLKLNNSDVPMPHPNKNNTVRTTDDPSTLAHQSKEIQKAVKDGATLEEAVSEKLQEVANNNLPPATTYGQHIFRNKSLQLFRTSEDAKPTGSYILGPGDKVAVSIWGPTEENMVLEIQKDGYIKPTGLPRYYIAGLTVEEAENLLYTKLRTKYYFARENYALTVTTSRTLNVHIVGEVFHSGTFNISAVNTAFNALVAAGGPNNIGSVRKIQLLRAGQEPVTIDVYAYLQNPVISQNVFLSENDFINVPVAQKIVEIKGAVKRPFSYELIDKESLSDLITFAGGLKATAMKSRIQIQRIEFDSVRILDIDYFDALKSGKKIALLDGDIIEVFEINNQIRNDVKIEGAVENPGLYAVGPEEKISDLLNKALLRKDAITDMAVMKRLNDDQKSIRYDFINLESVRTQPDSPENLVLRQGDELIISSKGSFVDKFSVKVSGAVRNPVDFDLDLSDNLRVADALFFAGGLTEDAIKDFAYIYRTRIDNPKSMEYIRLNLSEILENPVSEANISLEPGDQIKIYSKNNFTDETFIQVAGAVRSPGDFLYNPSLKLKDALLLAGGLKREASLDRVDVYRLSFEENKAVRVLAANLKIDENYQVREGESQFELEPFDQIFVRTAPEFELQRNIFVSGEVKYPGTYALLSNNMKLSSLIREAGNVTDEAFLAGAILTRGKSNKSYVIINLEKALKKPSSYENIILQEGDELFIPKLSNTVTIKGATRAAEMYPEKILAQGFITVPFIPGKSVRYYVDDYAGGFSDNAAKNKISVKDASGKVTKAKNYLFFKLYPKVGPGAEILVGTKSPDKPEGTSEKSNVKWGEVLANSIAQATAILSLLLLVQNIN